ncbi:MAG TPA: NAD(P)-dependent oxidoreductase [Anaerolineae bacterium]|nr:NAD(P)-dependent oxidoreductase [Anaerolineae bacterium]HQH39754.1 NAD(P)-dependent oxidoreductase [Anaerolineae bacterium]
MKILVTGGIGHVGRPTVARLLAHGHEVRILDRSAGADITAEAAAEVRGAEYRQVDIRDYAALRPHFTGMEAVVHLAAIPAPIPGKDAEIFSINGGGSFNVYQAAAEAGIKRVVCASSINALGNGFGVREIEIRYFPIDEDHPGWTSDVYSFSKQILEEIAAYFWRRAGLSSACLRFPWVYSHRWFESERSVEFHTFFRAAYDSLMALPEAERPAQVQQTLVKLRELRAQHERGEIAGEAMMTAMRNIPYAILTFGRSDFWTMLDARDAAQAIEKAVLADFSGSHPLWIVGSHNSTGLPTRELAALMYPDVQTWTRPVAGSESLVSIDKARALIGFEPEYTLHAED